MEIQAAVGGGGSKAKEIVEVWEIGKFTFQMSLSLNKVFFFPNSTLEANKCLLLLVFSLHELLHKPKNH